MKTGFPALLFSTALLFGACSSEDLPDGDPPIVIDLRGEIGATDVAVVGVTVAPDTGKRYVLDETRGIFEMDLEGKATVVLALEDFPASEVTPESAFTDLVSLGGDRFALTARNDGFLLDIGAGTLQQHFCYLPDDLPFDDVHQLTKSVTFDAEREMIYAQPQTIANENDMVLASSIGRFDQTTGDDLQWFPISSINYLSGAIAVHNGDLIMANDSKLSGYSMTTGAFDEITDLSRYGVANISGMAVDRATNSLLVVDSSSDELVELPLSVLD